MARPISPNPERDARLPYSHGMLVEGAARTLYISGQVGIDASGVTPQGFEAQARQAWSNLVGVLAKADMKLTDLVKITAFLTSADDYAAYGAIRSEFLAGHKPASTLLVVSALAQPAWKFEIEAVAVKAG